MNTALERMFTIYAQMIGSNQISDDLRTRSVSHIRELFEAGETDEERLTVKGLIFLKQYDGKRAESSRAQS
jgi:hypothetical protein